MTTISFLLEGDAAEYYHSLTKAVRDDWFGLMCVLGQRFDCISHELVYLSRMLRLKESEFPRHADYVREFRTCVSKSKVHTSDLQMGYLVNSRFVEGLSNDAVRRQYIVEVRSRWRSSRPFGFDTLVETIAEAAGPLQPDISSKRYRTNRERHQIPWVLRCQDPSCL